MPLTPTFTAGATVLCTGATSTYTATATNSSSITYSILNGTGASIDANTGLVSSVTGDFTVVATAANVCGATTTANRAVTLNANVTASIVIVSNLGNSITPGANVTFTSTPTNGGTTPIYQWKKNGSNVGMNQATYTDATLANNDVVKCEMTSNATCASPTIATSNDITIEVCNCSPTCSPLPTAAGSYDGAISYTDPGTGVTHYCDAAGRLLLSTKPVTTAISILPSAVHIKIGATPVTTYSQWCGEPSTSLNRCMMLSGTGNALINRWWHIDEPTTPVVTPSSRLQVSFYVKKSEYDALNTEISTNAGTPLTATTALRLYVPKLSTSLVPYAAPSLILFNKFDMIINNAANSFAPGTTTWKQTMFQNDTIIQAVFNVSSTKNSGGIGKF